MAEVIVGVATLLVVTPLPVKSACVAAEPAAQPSAAARLYVVLLVDVPPFLLMIWFSAALSVLLKVKVKLVFELISTLTVSVRA